MARRNILEEFLISAIDRLSEFGVFEKTEAEIGEAEEEFFVYRISKEYNEIAEMWLDRLEKSEVGRKLSNPHCMVVITAMGILTMASMKGRRLTDRELEGYTYAMLWYNLVAAKRQEKSGVSEEERQEGREAARVSEMAINLLREKGLTELLSPLESAGLLKAWEAGGESVDT